MKNKILICGIGSIGERHLNNLLFLGYDDIILYRKNNFPLRTIKTDFPVFKSLEKALDEKPDITFICNPTYLHVPTALLCAESGTHLFIEKPLSNNLIDLKKLKKILNDNNKKAMIGYMSRFNPCLLKGKEWIENGDIDEVIFARSQWGEYLPDWHPWEDYRKSYAANKIMGGGPALTLSHEIDTMLWFFGKVKNAKGIGNYNSDLQIDSEHACDILITFDIGVTANIHLDFIQKPPVRNMEIVGKKGRIYFDYYKNEICRIPTSDEEKQCLYSAPTNFVRNHLYLEELKYFFHCLESNKTPYPDINSATEVIRVALSCL